jgi:alkylation response protein AidB-like acyl-CoA dehydrogenase
LQLSLSDDQSLLVDTCRRLLEDHNPVTRVRELIDDPVGFDRSLWARGAELGWFSMLVPEEYGGGSVSGQGLVDLSLVAEELGRGLYPGPFLSTNVVAAAITELGTDEQKARYLPGIAAGDIIATWALAEPDRDWSATPSSLTATRSSRGFLLNGLKTTVQHGGSADLILVTASTPEGPAHFLVEPAATGVSVDPLVALDLTSRFSELRFDGVELDGGALLGRVGDAAASAELLQQIALCLQCADSNGVTDRGFAMTVQYSKDRVAFGRPIGSYQALKHRMAWYRVQLEGSYAIAAYASESVSRRREDAGIAARIAKAHVGKWSSVTLHDCVQMHGGIGMTWDYDLHLYVRRVISNEAVYGAPNEQYRKLVDLVEATVP